MHKVTISPNGRIMALPSSRSEHDESSQDQTFVSLMRHGLGRSPSPFENLRLPVIHFYEIKFRDAATGRMIGTIDCSKRGRPPDSMAFSSDSKTLVVKYLPANFRAGARRIR